MAEPALFRITQKLESLLTAADTSRKWFNQRSDEEPLDASEMPGGVIKAVTCDLQTSEGYTASRAADEWVAVIQIDLWSPNESANVIDVANQTSAGSVMALLKQNPTLDEHVGESDYLAFSGSDQHSYDLGCTIFEMKVRFQTVRGDFTALLKPNGEPVI